VLLSPSMGEGFGVPIVESQACGVPVITTDCSAMTELTEAGWRVDGDRWYNAAHDAWFKLPFIRGIVAGLELAYEARGDEDLRRKAREFALGYDVDTVMHEFWQPALAQLIPEAAEALAA
jgi:glycosyltransferase involved in cell wall biosynthesis